MLNFDILKETPHWLAVNKPNGLNVEQLWDYPSVENEVRVHLQVQGRPAPFVGIVHRLDRPVSGVLLLAKRKLPLKVLNQQFADKEVTKTYWAVTEKAPEKQQGILEHYLLKDQKAKRAFAFTSPRPKAILGRLSYTVLEKKDGKCLLEIQPHTGKYHQIRVQLAALGCPIVGDYKYGASTSYIENGIMLHAQTIVFKAPNTNIVEKITAPIPNQTEWNKYMTNESCN